MFMWRNRVTVECNLLIACETREVWRMRRLLTCLWCCRYAVLSFATGECRPEWNASFMRRHCARPWWLHIVRRGRGRMNGVIWPWMTSVVWREKHSWLSSLLVPRNLMLRWRRSWMLSDLSSQILNHPLWSVSSFLALCYYDLWVNRQLCVFINTLPYY